jgi:hypothetical protein
MVSPLLTYVNAYILITSEGSPEVINGRITKVEDQRYVIGCYLKRQQSTGTSTGADYLPSQVVPGQALPGTSGVVYLYNGYALRHAPVGSGYILGSSSNEGLAWTDIEDTRPEWLYQGIRCEHLQGNEPLKYCTIERISGVYGNEGIDRLINKEIGGIPIVIRSGDLID